MEAIRNKSRYPFVVEPTEEGAYYVRFPDFPTIFTGGLTEEEALRNAREALETHLEALANMGRPLPRRRPLLFVPVSSRLRNKLEMQARRTGQSVRDRAEELLREAVG